MMGLSPENPVFGGTFSPLVRMMYGRSIERPSLALPFSGWSIEVPLISIILSDELVGRIRPGRAPSPRSRAVSAQLVRRLSSSLDIVQPMLKGTDEDAPWVEKAATMTRNDLEAEVKRALGLEPDDVVVTFRCTASQLERINAGVEKCRSVMMRSPRLSPA